MYILSHEIAKPYVPDRELGALGRMLGGEKVFLTVWRCRDHVLLPVKEPPLDSHQIETAWMLLGTAVFPENDEGVIEFATYREHIISLYKPRGIKEIELGILLPYRETVIVGGIEPELVYGAIFYSPK